MPLAYSVANNRIEVTGYTEAVPCNFTDLWNADKAGTLSLHARASVAAVDGAPVAVDRAERPTDYVVLGGASNDLYITVANWNNMTTATIRVIGTDRDGAAQTDDVVVNAAGNFSTALWFATITDTQVTVFTKSNAGSFDYDLIQGQWGVVWKQGTAQFLLDCQLYCNDATAWFADAGKQVEFGEGAAAYTAIEFLNGHLRLGTLEDVTEKRTSNGCDIYWAYTAHSSRYLIVSDYADCHLYSSSFATAVYQTLYLRGRGGTRRVWNCILKNNLDFNACNNTDFYKVFAQKGSYGIRSCLNSTFEDVFVTDQSNTSLYSQNTPATLRGLYCRGNPVANVAFNGHTIAHMYFVDCDLSAWTFNWWGAITKDAYRQYTFNLRVVDSAGVGIQGATASMVDVNGTPIFSVATDASGDIAEQTITYAIYVKLTQTTSTETVYSPHTVTIRKAGYPTRSIVYTMDRPREEIEKLGGAAPHGREYRRRRVPGEVSVLDEYEYA